MESCKKVICNLVEKVHGSLPVKVLQIGEGNFLRAFADWYIDCANDSQVFNGGVAVVTPTLRGNPKRLNSQNCMYSVTMRGRHNGDIVDTTKIITSINKCYSFYSDTQRVIEIAKSDDLQIIISNTTEAGIEYIEGEKFEDFPGVSYPAKLTALLYNRFTCNGSGLVILPTELIEDNGKILKKYVLKYANDWQLGSDFIDYVKNECSFCTTLVDRIVTGFPSSYYNEIKNRLGFEDNLAVACEPYASWVIEGDERAKQIFPLHKVFDSIVWCNDVKPYRTRKVKILNGTHTMMVASAYLCSFKIVRDVVNDELFSLFIKKGLFDEIIKTVDLPIDEVEDFANSVLERFNNPFIDHKLIDISLNSVSKFKARCLPSIIDYQNLTGALPDILCFSLSSLIEFYKHDFTLDSDSVLEFMKKGSVWDILSNKSLWGCDLTRIDGLYNKVNGYYNDIQTVGINEAVKKVVYEK